MDEDFKGPSNLRSLDGELVPRQKRKRKHVIQTRFLSLTNTNVNWQVIGRNVLQILTIKPIKNYSTRPSTIHVIRRVPEVFPGHFYSSRVTVSCLTYLSQNNTHGNVYEIVLGWIHLMIKRAFLFIQCYQMHSFVLGGISVRKWTETSKVTNRCVLSEWVCHCQCVGCHCHWLPLSLWTIRHWHSVTLSLQCQSLTVSVMLPQTAIVSLSDTLSLWHWQCQCDTHTVTVTCQAVSDTVTDWHCSASVSVSDTPTQSDRHSDSVTNTV